MVLSMMLRVGVLEVLDRPSLEGSHGPLDPAVQGTSALNLIEYTRSGRESQVSIREAIESAEGPEPPIFAEHDGAEHFAGFYSPRRDAYPTPRYIKQIVEKCRGESSKKRARN